MLRAPPSGLPDSNLNEVPSIFTHQVYYYVNTVTASTLFTGRNIHFNLGANGIQAATVSEMAHVLSRVACSAVPVTGPTRWSSGVCGCFGAWCLHFTSPARDSDVGGLSHPRHAGPRAPWRCSRTGLARRSFLMSYCVPGSVLGNCSTVAPAVLRALCAPHWGTAIFFLSLSLPLVPQFYSLGTGIVPLCRNPRRHLSLCSYRTPGSCGHHVGLGNLPAPSPAV